MHLIHDQIKAEIDETRFNELCSAVVSLDKSILFCALAQKSGYLITIATNQNNEHDGRSISASRNDVMQQHLSDAEIARYAFHTGIMCGLHKFWERKLGSIQHFVSHYDEMPLATIFLGDGHFLLMGIDSAKQHGIDRIVTQKIIPFLRKGTAVIQK
jgi:hypothetical protein